MPLGRNKWAEAVVLKAVQPVLEWVSTPTFEGFVTRLLIGRAASLPADNALRFLFRLNTAIYPLLGRKAVEYGGGVHTKHRHTRYHDFFTQRIRAGERVLDIGCGVGVVAFDIAQQTGAAVVGIDLSSDNIATARERYRHPQVEYRVQDGLQDCLDGPFDVVVLSNILEHLPDRPAFLRRIRDVTKASRILIRVPLFERDWQVPLKRELGVEWRLDTTHETEYTHESFAQEMVDAGIEVVHQEVRWGEIWAEAVTNGSQS